MSEKFMIVVTHSTDNQDRANGAFALAYSLLESDGADVALFFIFEGAMAAKKKVAESIEGRNLTPVRELLPALLEKKVPMYVCQACVKTYEIDKADLIEGVRITGIPTLSEEMQGRKTITF